MTKSFGKAARGTETGRPIMVLLDVLGQRWTLRILWELRSGRVTFRVLSELCDNVSPSLLNKRLKQLRELSLVDHDGEGYGLTEKGGELAAEFVRLNRWAESWAEALKDK